MSVPQSEHIQHTFEERVEVSDALQAVYLGCESAERYFMDVLLPNLLPERYPESEQPGCSWIGRKAKLSIHLSKVALADHFQQLVEDGELEEAIAYRCAEILAVPMAVHEARILPFARRTSP